MTENRETNDIGTMSFEAALKELEDIVKQLEGGRADLDEAIAKFERGTRLKEHCESKLREAKAKVERITERAGMIGTEPAEGG